MILQESYVLPLVEKKVKNHQIIALHLMVALAVAGAGAVFYTFMQEVQPYGLALMIGGASLLIVSIFRNRWLIKAGVNRLVRVAELSVTIAIFYYVARHGMTPAMIMFGTLSAAIIFAFIWERETNRGLVVHINNDGLKLPVTLRRNLDWKDVESIILKFGILTVNATNNRMFQWTVAEMDFDTKSFDKFCREQISKGKEQRDKNDW